MFATDTLPDTNPEPTPAGRTDGLALIRAGLDLLAGEDPARLIGPARSALVTDLAVAADRVRAILQKAGCANRAEAAAYAARHELLDA